MLRLHFVLGVFMQLVVPQLLLWTTVGLLTFSQYHLPAHHFYAFGCSTCTAYSHANRKKAAESGALCSGKILTLLCAICDQLETSISPNTWQSYSRNANPIRSICMASSSALKVQCLSKVLKIYLRTDQRNWSAIPTYCESTLDPKGLYQVSQEMAGRNGERDLARLHRLRFQQAGRDGEVRGVCDRYLKATRWLPRRVLCTRRQRILGALCLIRGSLSFALGVCFGIWDPCFPRVFRFVSLCSLLVPCFEETCLTSFIAHLRFRRRFNVSTPVVTSQLNIHGPHHNAPAPKSRLPLQLVARLWKTPFRARLRRVVKATDYREDLAATTRSLKGGLGIQAESATGSQQQEWAITTSFCHPSFQLYLSGKKTISYQSSAARRDI
ncbi:hypothetical protein C8J56DRAFT_486202 [Mycena floridula]|nr:hypothetical protein C8J56DRAFT_486202 [Mycena floridula]